MHKRGPLRNIFVNLGGDIKSQSGALGGDIKSQSGAHSTSQGVDLEGNDAQRLSDGPDGGSDFQYNYEICKKYETTAI